MISLSKEKEDTFYVLQETFYFLVLCPMKRAFLVVWGLLVILWISQISYTFAQPLLTQGKALKLAEQYIENSLSDEAWKDNNPHISAQTPFHVDDSKVVSYIEYKVSCDSTPDCGFILVNVDKNDVAVPIASPTGNTPSELLDTGAWESDYYYFSPFDIYAENLETGFVQALDPGKAVDPREESDLKLSKEEKDILKEQKQALKDELKAAKQQAKEYKKSQDFKDRKLEIQDQIFSVPKEEFSMKVLPQVNAVTYTSPWASNTFISWGTYTVWCNWQTPCYKQFNRWYWVSRCPVWCTPNALWIIFGWYDRNGYPDLLPWTAARINNSDIDSMISQIGTYMWTSCSWGEWATSWWNTDDWIQYAKDKWYTSAYGSNYTFSTFLDLFNKIKNEVNNNRPSILHIGKPPLATLPHSIVVFWYRYNTTPYIVRVNMWWWWGILNNWYYWSNIDQNLSSIYYNSAEWYSHQPFWLSRIYMN